MQIHRQAKEIQYFFYSQAFADGLRASFAIVLPALIGSYFHQFDIGLTISLGAMGASLTDAPGPLIQKSNGMLFCALFAFLVAVLTALARLNTLTMGMEVALVTFFFSMFTVYGNRATSVGSVAILIMILTMDKPVPGNEVILHALLIAAGVLFYWILSLLLHTLRPYRIAQRALGESIREIATYLSIKADFYLTHTLLQDNYRKLVAQQIVVNEKQDMVRELLFKTRQIVKESTRPGRKLLFTFIETVDLFEDITASYYDYALLRNEFGDTGALDQIGLTIKKMALELDQTGVSIQTNTLLIPTFDYDEELRKLKNGIDTLTRDQAKNTVVLKKILVNLRKILAGIKDIRRYFERDIERKSSRLDHAHFVSHQSLDPKLFWDNLSFQSSVFKHAVRVSVACMAGFIIAKMIALGHHSYWILLTIAFIIKPAFGLTRQRNVQRITGTLAGAAIGILILVLIHDKTVLFVLMVLFMIGSYSFMRIRYLAMVICVTPYVLILFSFLGAGYKVVALERFMDTLIGCAIAIMVSYFLFPDWESGKLNHHVKGILFANAAYLRKMIEALSGKKVSILEYKLARKNVYLNSANLTAAFQRMLSEPKSKQTSEQQLHQFVVLNHILFSNIATVTTTLLSRQPQSYPKELLHTACRAYENLKNSYGQLSGEWVIPAIEKEKTEALEQPTPADEMLMKEQVDFIYKVSVDIEKNVSTLALG